MAVLDKVLRWRRRPAFSGRLMVFITAFALAWLGSVAYVGCLPDVFASTARVFVGPETYGIDLTNAFDLDMLPATLEGPRSAAVLAPVIKQLNLDARWARTGAGDNARAETRALDLLRRRIAVRPVRCTRLITITAYGNDRNETAEIANAVSESYVTNRVKALLEYYADNLDRLKQRRQADEKRIQDLLSGAPRSGDDAFSYGADGKDYLLGLTRGDVKLTTARINGEPPATAEAHVVDEAAPGEAPLGFKYRWAFAWGGY